MKTEEERIDNATKTAGKTLSNKAFPSRGDAESDAES